LRVLALRGVTPLKWLAFNNFGAQALERSVRAHGNFIEYVPMVLLMMYFAEVAELSALRLHITGTMLLLGRVMHGICFGFLEFNMPLRFGGMVLTLLALINISVSLLVVAL
ncbi:MAPEG family protein, partial [Planktomarina temperata]|nr:MAPEG family protein [Planktomarina temperata]